MVEVTEGDRVRTVRRTRRFRNATPSTVGVEGIKSYPDGKGWAERVHEWCVADITDHGEPSDGLIQEEQFGVHITLERADGHTMQWRQEQLDEMLADELVDKDEVMEFRISAELISEED